MGTPAQLRYAETPNPGTIVFQGKVLTGANGNASTVTGLGLTCVKTATGVYTFTLDKAYKKLVSAGFGIASATILAPQMAPAGDTVATDGKVVVTLLNTSSANTNATSGDTIFYEIVVDKLGLL
jgi:hypothetical protein